MPTVDNKVVQMTFKNEQFERGVRESLHSLEELKKALDLDKSAESLSNLEKIAGSFDISGIAKGIDDIANRFTLVGNLGQEAFRRISSFALDQVHKVTSAITSMPQIGMGKYEQKNKAVQMIQSAMPEKSIEEIEAVLGKLNEYTDLTSYDFSTMANSIGKFVSAGIDLEVAEKAMEGIANETASAGGEIAQANIAMYNFSQALATGSVRLMDWHSIENANLATKEFKEQIIETAYELGALNKVQDNVGVTAKGNTVTFENFAQTLQDGWFTSDVLIKVLEKYADREEGVGKKGFEAAKIAITFTQAMDAVKDAISTGWMTSFGYLFGNLEEAGDLFTRISDAIIGFAEQIYNTRNELLKGWHDGGKDGISGYQKVIEGLSNSWAVFSGVIEAAKTAFKSVFGALNSSGLIEASKAFADFTGKVKEFFGVWTEETPENFSFFSGSETEEIKHVGSGVLILARAFRVIFSIAKSGINVIGSVLQIVGNLFKIVQPLASGIFNVASSIGYTLSYIVDLASATLAGKDALISFSAVLSPVSNAFKKAGSFLNNFAETIQIIVSYLRSGIGLDGIRKVFEYNGNPTLKKYGLFIIDALEKMGNIAKAVAPVFKSIFGIVTAAFSAIWKFMSGKIMDGLTAVSSFLANLFADVNMAEVMTKALNGIATALKVVLGIAAGAGYGVFSLARAIVNGSVALFNFVKNSEFFQNFLKTVSEKSKPIREFFQSVWESLSSISGKIGEFKGFGDVWTAFMTAMRDNPIGKKFVPAIQKARNLIADFVQKIKGLVNSVKNAFSLLQQFKDPSKVLNFLSLSKIKDAGVEKILEFFEKIKSVFGGVKGAAGEAKSAVGGFFSNLIPNLKAFGQRLGEMIGGFFSVDTSGIQGLPQKLLARLEAFNPVIDWIKGKFSQIKDFVMDPDKLLSHVVGALKGIGEFIINIFKNVNLGTIWDTAKTALGTYIMLTFAKSLKSFSESFGVLTGAIDKDEKDGFADKLRSIAITIAIVTAAIAGLAFIPAKEAAIGVGIMAMALTVVAGAIIALNKFAPNTKGLGKGILSMALSIGAVIGAIAAAAILVKTGGDLTKPLLLVGGIMAALGVVAWAMNRFSKNQKSGSKGQAKTILAMCAGLILVVTAIGQMADLLKKYSLGDNNKFIGGGMATVWGMLITLGTIAVLMSHLGKEAKDGSTSQGVATTIFAMCNGISAIVRAVGSMAALMKQYPDQIGWAYGMIEGILITMGAVAVLLAKFSGDMDWKVSLVSAVPIIAMGWFLDKITKTLGEAIQKVSGVDPKVIEQFLIGVGEVITAMIGTVAIFSKIGIGGLLEAAGGIVALMAAIGVGVDIVATFAADAVEKLANAIWLVGSKLADFSDFTSRIDAEKIEVAMTVLTNTILPSITTMANYTSAIQAGVGAAANIWLFGEALGLFQRSISGITVDTGAAIKKLPEDVKAAIDGINAIQGVNEAIDVLYNLGGALNLYYNNLAQAASGETVTDDSGNFDITKANQAFNDLAELTLDDETLAKIKGYATGGTNDLNKFSNGIANLGTALKSYGNNISTINEEKVNKANEILENMKDLDSYLNPVGEVNYDILSGKRTSISEFGLDIAALGDALGKYGDSVSGLNPGKIIMSSVVIDTVAKIFKDLPETGGLWQLVSGEKKLGDFASNMSSLGDGLANYANKVSGADFTNVEASVGPISALASAQSVIQKNGGIASVLAGSSDLGQLGTGLVGLGDSLVQFATADKGIKTLKEADFTKIAQAIDPIKKLAQAQSILQNEGGWTEFLTGSSNLGNLGTGLENFASHLITFNNTIKDFDFNDEKFTSAMDLLKRVVSLQQIVQNGDAEYDFANAGRNLSTLFATIATSITDDTQIVDAIDGAIQSINTVIQTNAVDPATTWGGDLVTNFATGMQNNASVAEKAAIAIANIIRSYLHFSQPDKGPLADADTYGGDFMDTFAGGMLDNLGTVKDAVSGVASTVRDTLGETASNALSNLIDGTVQSSEQSFMGKLKAGFSQALSSVFGETENPVITPVLDLTNVDEGVSQISNKLNGSSIGVGTNLAANVASGNGTTIIQGGTFDVPDHSPEIISAIQNLGDRIVSLESQTVSIMSNLRVVMNTKALVGQIAPEMDRVLGNYANRM